MLSRTDRRELILYYKENFAQAKERFETYWEKENTERCLLAMWVQKKGAKLPLAKEYTLE